jgi:hypothetical protein
MVRIRAYQSEDQERLEACILELQNFEHVLEPDRVEGTRIVARNREDLLAIVRQNRGQIFVAEMNAEVVGFVCVFRACFGMRCSNPAWPKEQVRRSFVLCKTVECLACNGEEGKSLYSPRKEEAR